MSTMTPAVKTATTDDELIDDYRALDLDSATPVAVPGATVIFADAYTSTDERQALRFDGDVPLFVVGLYSERDVRSTLADAGYADEDIERAFTNGEWAEEHKQGHMTQAIAIAERLEVCATTDGGEQSDWMGR